MTKLREREISGCHRCGTKWGKCEAHFTTHVYSPDGRVAAQCFPLCEECWGALGPEDRLPFYKELFDCWVASGSPDCNGIAWDDVWQTIRKNVLSGM